MDTQERLDQLHLSFPAERIHGNAAFAPWGRTYLDAREVARAIDGKTWKQVDHPYLALRHDALGFLSTRELVQLLPVYLRSVVEEGLRSPALDSLLVELTRPKREPALGRFDALVLHTHRFAARGHRCGAGVVLRDGSKRLAGKRGAGRTRSDVEAAFRSELCATLGWTNHDALASCLATEWFIFAVTHGTVWIASLVDGLLGPRRVLVGAAALGIPAVNAAAHILPALRTHTYNPGLVTAV